MNDPNFFPWTIYSVRGGAWEITAFRTRMTQDKAMHHANEMNRWTALRTYLCAVHFVAVPVPMINATEE